MEMDPVFLMIDPDRPAEAGMAEAGMAARGAVGADASGGSIWESCL